METTAIPSSLEPTSLGNRTQRESNRAQWVSLHQEFENLELTGREFCLERGLNYCTFKSWKSTLRKEQRASAAPRSTGNELFRELSPDLSGSSSSQYLITLRIGRTLSIEGSFIESRLRKLIEILESC